MRVSDYAPKMYDNNIEMQAILNAEEDELELGLKFNIDNSFKDEFAETATITGIEKYEKLLNIPLDANRDNLDYRRAMIINKLSTSAPLSYRWLEENLINLVGKDNFKIDLDAENYRIKINIADVYINIAKTLYNIYRKLFPANLVIEINVFEEYFTNLYVSGVTLIGEKILIKGGEIY